MKPGKGCRILIAGVGGQGALTMARLLCGLFVGKGRHVVSGQLHGMTQRGGSVGASVVVDQGISPVIPREGAHIVLGLEPVETARAIDRMSGQTKVFMNTSAVIPFELSQRHVLGEKNAAYPEIRQIVAWLCERTPHVYARDATKLAEEAGSPKTLGVVMLGWLLGSGALAATPEEFVEHVLKTTPPDIFAANERAFLLGVRASRDDHLHPRLDPRAGRAE